MDTLVAARRSWLSASPVVGTPAQWAGQTALLGGLVGWTSIFTQMLPSLFTTTGTLLDWVFFPGLWGTAALGAVVGAAFGVFQPAVLDRVRGRVALPLVMVGEGLVAAAAGAFGGGATFLFLSMLYGFPSPDFMFVAAILAFGSALLGGVTTLAWWLPFTIATVLGRRTWPITVAVATTVPSLLVLIGKLLV